ncbi:MAG: phasin family protein [Nitrospiraceae bacterium]|nr:MAG: phasin family protein [Nitrospiraceae bacterium]
MTLFESIRRALMAGLGVQEKVKELVDELVKKGELSETQGAQLVKEWTDKVGKSGDNLGQSITDIINKTLEKMNIPTREEIDRIDKKLLSISSRLKKIEESRKTTGNSQA